MKTTHSSLLLCTLCAVLAACAPQEANVKEGLDDMARGEDFAALPQELVTGATNDSNGRGDSKTFFLAIRRSALTKRYFLSAYLTQTYPANDSNVPFFSLDTKVVSFREQNGKIFVFDVDNTKTWSAQMDPEVIVDAYPILNSATFASFPHANDYVLVDPSAGLNKFTAVSDAASRGGVAFKVELMYAKRFHRYSDGISFDQVFTGYSNQPDPDAVTQGPENLFRASGTLTISVRSYTESPGFQPSPYSSHFFYSKVAQVPNTPDFTANSIKWNVYRGMKPIPWVISRNILEIAQRPEFREFNVVGSMKRAIENWNAAYEFPVFSAEIAGPEDAIGDEDHNFVMVDDNPSAPFAFADSRDNPNTGEIRAASVYFSSVWFEAALSVADMLSSEVTSPSTPTRAELAAMTAQDLETWANGRVLGQTSGRPQLRWGSFERQEGCSLRANEVVAKLRLARLMRQRQGLPTASTLTRAEIFERFLTHVLAHEVGHTLGLRHNFKGSMAGTNPSSVMDYLTDIDSVTAYQPGAYDVAALAYLHGRTSARPAQAFCNDSGVRRDAECAPFDWGTNPWTQTVKPDYLAIIYDIDIFGWLFNLDLETHSFARGGPTAAVRQDAFDTLMIPAGPIDPALLASDPFYGPWFDLTSRFALDATYLRTTGQRIQTAVSANNDPKTITLCGDIIINKDKIRSFSSRSVCVDVLNKLHTTAALVGLRAARTALDQPENQPPSTATEAVKATFAALKAKVDRTLNNWMQ